MNMQLFKILSNNKFVRLRLDFEGPPMLRRSRRLLKQRALLALSYSTNYSLLSSNSLNTGCSETLKRLGANVA